MALARWAACWVLVVACHCHLGLSSGAQPEPSAPQAVRRAASRPDIVLADFESPNFGAWSVEGDAFGAGPAQGTLAAQQEVSGYLGRGLASSYHGGDAAQGSLTSPSFPIERKYLNLLVGGGNLRPELAVELLAEPGGQPLRRATGSANTGADDEHLSWRSWDLADLEGRQVRLRIVDRVTGSWGHISVDQIEQADTRREVTASSPELALAMSSVAGAASRAARDPLRPLFHFRPPALWSNDPNAPFFHEGWYHVFYQHNPFGDRWGHMHWGHARSRDLVHWEHLPIALAPSADRGEEHCFSGTAARDAEGRLRLFYTSIGARAPEQWLAAPVDSELLVWSKSDRNPVLTEKLHGTDVIDDWRDPYFFETAGRRFLVCGGHRRGGHGCVLLYEALDGALEKWVYRGVLFEGTEANWECPNLFPLGDRWVLIYSPHGVVRYFTGRLDLAAYRFVPEQQGLIDASENYYAPNGLYDGHRQLLWGWVRGFPEGRGWNGCFSLPRELTLSPQGHLLQQPAAELVALREELLVELADIPLPDTVLPLEARGDRLEIEIVFDVAAEGRGGLIVRRSDDGTRGLSLARDERQRDPNLTPDQHVLEVTGLRAPVGRSFGAPFRLRVFLDGSVAEIHSERGPPITRVIDAAPDDLGLALFGEGLVLVHELRVWRLKSSW